MEHIKYPRTFHVPSSPGATSDDKILPDLSCFVNKHIHITEKMDGECSTLYQDGFHARSLDSRHHPSRDWLARYHDSFRWLIGEDYRICGENLYARHSIPYDDLPSYFFVHSVWFKNVCLDLDSQVEYLMNIEKASGTLFYTPHTLSVMYRVESEKALQKEIDKLAAYLDTNRTEGFVIRNAQSFHYDDFGTNVAKWVRPSHVQTDEHWMQKAIVPNKLRISR